MTETINLSISDMTCAGCVARVEKTLMQQPGVRTASVSLASGLGRVVLDTKLGAPLDLAQTVTNAGYPAQLTDNRQSGEENSSTRIEGLLRKALFAAVLTLPVFLLEMGSHIFPAFRDLIGQSIGHTFSWSIQFILISLVLLFPGREFFAKGIPAILRGAPDMNALVAVGTFAAWTYSTLALFAPNLFPEGTLGVYFEAAGVITTLILLGRWLEARALGKTGSAIRKLAQLAVREAPVRQGEIFVDTPLEDVKPGDILLVRSGARVAVDGIVLDGQSYVDESMLTGEAMPILKSTSDTITSGTLNGNGTLTYKATAVGTDTVLSQIIEMVRSAQMAKLPIQELIDKVTLIFVPVIFGIAALTFVLWYLLGPQPALPFAFVAATSVLIIACPCAMGLATPMSITVGSGIAAERGVLFRKGDALQKLQSAEIVAFDKTGTLTSGKPQVVHVQATSDADDQDVLAVAAAIEAHSDHPVAIAITAAASKTYEPEVTDVQVSPGMGVAGTVAGQRVIVGSARFMAQNQIEVPAFLIDATDGSPVFVAKGRDLLGRVDVADPLRPEALKVISSLREQGKQAAIVSGDLEKVTLPIAKALGIDHVVAEVLPGEKVDAMNALKSRGGRVAFVGDGINDSPVLAAADVGIALGTGTDVAIEAADVVLMSGNLDGVVTAFEISRRTLLNIKQNLLWAFAYNVLLIPVAAGILFVFGGPMLSPMLAALAMALSSVFVISNALRLRRQT